MAKKDKIASVAAGTGSGVVTGAAAGGIPGAVIGGLFGLGQSLYQNHAQAKSDKKQQEYARENAKFQAARQDYLQQLEMNYNSPANQMAMLKKAGLNPNLIYDQLQDFTTSAPSAPMPANNVGSPRTMDVAGPSIAGAQLGMQQQQTSATVDLAVANARKANADATKQEIDNDFEHVKVSTEINKMVSDIDKILQDTNLTKEQIDLLQKQKDYLIEKAKFEASKTEGEVGLVSAQTGNVTADTSLKNAQTTNVKEDTNLKKSQSAYTNSLKDMIDSKKQYQDLINAIQVRENELRDMQIDVEERAAGANFDMWTAVNDFCKENEDLEGKEAAIFDAMMEYYARAGIHKANNDYNTYANELRTPSFWLDIIKTILNQSNAATGQLMGSEKKK